MWYLAYLIQVEEARTKVSETSTKMYNSVLDAHEKAKDLDDTFKNLTKEVQNLSKENEALEAQQTEAIKKQTELELDMKDLQEKISGNIQTKVLFWWLNSVDIDMFAFSFAGYFIEIFLFPEDKGIPFTDFLCFQDDAIKQLHVLEKEIQESTEELDKISPLYEAQVIKEKEITKGYVWKMYIFYYNAVRENKSII